MFTVSVTFTRTGMSSVYEADRVHFTPRGSEGDDGSVIDDRDFGITIFNSSGSIHIGFLTPFKAFVMNESGKTVATYSM